VWARRRFRGGKVWARVRPDGALETDAGGRVEVKYRIEDTRSYRAAASNLEPLADADDREPSADPAPAAAPPPRSSGSPRETRTGKPPILVYTDGACTGNPGPMGIGVVLIAGRHRKEISEYLGPLGTNNVAELTAILRALEMIKDRRRPIVVHSDSSYAIGVLSQGWKAKANVDLVARIRDLLAQFDKVRFVKVAGHSGVPENERSDELARAAIARGH